MNSAATKSSLERIQINENYRLWLICDRDFIHHLPCMLLRIGILCKRFIFFTLATLIFDAVKFTPQVSNYSRTRQLCLELENKKEDFDAGLINEAAIIHSVMVHSNLINKNYKW